MQCYKIIIFLFTIVNIAKATLDPCPVGNQTIQETFNVEKVLGTWWVDGLQFYEETLDWFKNASIFLNNGNVAVTIYTDTQTLYDFGEYSTNMKAETESINFRFEYEYVTAYIVDTDYDNYLLACICDDELKLLLHLVPLRRRVMSPEALTRLEQSIKTKMGNYEITPHRQTAYDGDNMLYTVATRKEL